MLLLYYIAPGYNVILRQQLSLFTSYDIFEVCACLWVCHQIQVFNSDTPVYASVLDWQSQNTRLWLLDLIPHWTRAAFSLTASFVNIMWASRGCRATLLIRCSLSSLSDLIPDQRCPCCLPFGLGQCVLWACHQHRRSDAQKPLKTTEICCHSPFVSRMLDIVMLPIYEFPYEWWEHLNLWSQM